MASKSNYSALEIGSDKDRIKTGGEEDVFNHFDNDEKITPPPGPTIYTAAVVTTLGVSLKDDLLLSLLVVLPSWIMIFFNAAASLIIIEFIHQLRDETPVCEANKALLILGVVIFNTYNVGEMFETIDIALWIHQFKTVDAHEALAFAKTGDDGDKKIVSGMTLWFKFVCYVVIVLPKLAIGVLLAFYGSGFLLVSDGNESLILNTVGLTFITQIDELVYFSMVPGNVKKCIDDLPSCDITYTHKMIGLARPYLVSAIIATITYASYLVSCGGAGAEPLAPSE